MPNKMLGYYCAIFSAACFAMLEKVALQAAEVGCYTTTRSQQFAIFLTGYAWPGGKLEKTRIERVRAG